MPDAIPAVLAPKTRKRGTTAVVSTAGEAAVRGEAVVRELAALEGMDAPWTGGWLQRS